MKTEDILNEREKTHGDYSKVSETAIKLEDILNYACTLNNAPAKKLALKMICLKLARIVCGDPNFADHWDDIAGYAMLGKREDEPTEFEKECLTPFGEGEVHFWQEGATRPKEDYQLKEEQNEQSCERCGVKTVCLAQYLTGSPFFCIRCTNEIADFVINGGRASLWKSHRMQHELLKSCPVCKKEKVAGTWPSPLCTDCYNERRWQ